MARLALFDPNCYKFTDDMFLYWDQKGHEVKRILYYDPQLVKWADVIWFETCDNNLHQATQEVINGETAESVNLRDKKVICRVIDIEAWAGLHRNVNWSYVDETIFIAPHMWDLVLKDVDVGKNQIISCGVNLDRFTLRKNPLKNKKIAWIAERWHAKGIDYFLQYAALLYKKAPDYKIYAVGIWADDAKGSWYRAYIDQFLKDNPMNVEFIDYVPDINEFLEDKTYTILFSKKEAFSYAIAEAMSKGLKPIIHNFYGCSQIWNKKYVWNTLDEALEMTLDNNYNPLEYRQYIKNNYPLDKMLTKFDQIIGGQNVQKN